MSKNNFSLKKRLASFKHAFNGMSTLLKEEHNARIHLAAALLVIALGILLELNSTEWFIVLLLIGFVFAMELINSAIENLCDFVSPERNDYIKKAKDLGAAAVLVSAIIAAIIGLWIFIPKIVAFVESFFLIFAALFIAVILAHAHLSHQHQKLASMSSAATQ